MIKTLKVKALQPFTDSRGDHKAGDVYEAHHADLLGLLNGKMVAPFEETTERAVKPPSVKREDKKGK